jgi:CDP-diacylglycerol---serine O-phosphatidyltransferase
MALKRPRMIAVLPTMLTLGNAACGFGAITFAARLGPEQAGGNHLLIASLLIFLGMLFDALDGSAARLTNQTSEIGAQLDSLCDAITFGVAPAFLMLQFVRYEHVGSGVESAFAFHPRFLWTIGLLYALCAILRLARFNVETDEEVEGSHDHFSGLPSPAAAATVAAFPIGMRELMLIADSTESAWLATWLLPGSKVVLVVVTLSVAILMVSRVQYPHLFNQWVRGRRSRRHVIQLVFAVAVIFWVHELAAPILSCWFAFAAPIKAGWKEVASGRLYNSRSV